MTDQRDDASLHRAGLPGCAVVTRLRGGSPAGTAARMRSWLLIEQPGPWTVDALDRTLAAAFPPARRERIASLRAAEGFRPLLIRRPGRHQREPSSAPRTVMVGGGTPGNRWLERLEVGDLGDLAALDLDAVAGGAGGIGQPVKGPVFLACTHGTKDMCCAVLGRPLVAALDANHPGRTWETSHVGGDRWAGNLLVVPDGYLHGQLGPDEGARVAKAALNGEIDPERLRGRTTAPTRWAQYAEIAVRRDLRDGGTRRGLDDVLAVGEEPLPGRRAPAGRGGAGHDPDPEPEGRVVTVRAGQERFRVTVRRRPTTSSSPSRCTELAASSDYTTEAITPVLR